MTNLVFAVVFLPLSHFLIASTRLRDQLIGCLGEKRYFRRQIYSSERDPLKGSTDEQPETVPS